jgi:hypothetical protein
VPGQSGALISAGISAGVIIGILQDLIGEVKVTRVLVGRAIVRALQHRGQYRRCLVNLV